MENCTGVPCITTGPGTGGSFTCGTSTVADIDGNTYNTVLIGTQCWTKENLRVRKYNDGTEIPFNTSGGTAGNVSSTWNTPAIGRHTIYAHDSTAVPSNLSNYGYLYNYYAAAGIITVGGTPTKNIYPTGYHVPTDLEWSTLVIYLDATALATTTGVQSSTAGTLMKSTSALWNAATPPSPGTNTSGFTGLPGGNRGGDGRFSFIRSLASFWSATENGSSDAWSRYLYFYDGSMERNSGNKAFGNSVRCLKD